MVEQWQPLVHEGPWGLCIRRGEEEVHLRFPSFVDLGLFVNGKKKILKRMDQVEAYSRRQHFPKPENIEIVPGKMWCPYCRKPRTFWEDEDTHYCHCEICGISDRDFHVCKENDRWPTIRDRKGRMKFHG